MRQLEALLELARREDWSDGDELLRQQLGPATDHPTLGYADWLPND